MIKKNSKNTGGVYNGTTEISSIYKGTTLEWEGLKTLTTEGVPPLTLQKCGNKNMLGYKVYGQCTQSSTPSETTPVEVQTVGNKTNNYFDTKKVSRYNTDITIGDDSLSVVSGYQIIVNFKPYDLKPNTTYTLKYHLSRTQAVSNVQGRFRFAKDDGATSLSVINYSDDSSLELDLIGTFTTPSDIREYKKLWLYSGSSATTKFENIQLVEGTYTLQTMPAYESYGYNIPIKVSGNNLFDAENLFPNTTYTNNGVTLTRSGQEFTLNGSRTDKTKVYDAYSEEMVLPAGSYTFTIRNTEQFDGTIAMYMYPRVNGHDGSLLATSVIGKISTNYYNVYTQRFTLENTTTVRFRSFLNYNSDTTYNNTKFVAQLLKGTYTNSNIIAYEKYFTPRTTNIYLREPLRKLDNYIDYIDFENQKVYRNVGQQYYDGYTNSVTRETTRYTDYSRYTLANFSPTNAQTGASEELCNYCPQGSTPNKFYVGYNTAGFLYLSDTLIGVTSDDTSSGRIAKANNWLKTLTPVLYIVYPRSATGEESITLPNILLNKGTNIVSVDTTTTPSNMWIKYKGKE